MHTIPVSSVTMVHRRLDPIFASLSSCSDWRRYRNAFRVLDRRKRKLHLGDEYWASADCVEVLQRLLVKAYCVWTAERTLLRFRPCCLSPLT
jgi:hypothetical protein